MRELSAEQRRVLTAMAHRSEVACDPRVLDALEEMGAISTEAKITYDFGLLRIIRSGYVTDAGRQALREPRP